jgi:hypothetical protein
MLASNVVDHGFKPQMWWIMGSSPAQIKTKILKLEFAVYPLSMQH